MAGKESGLGWSVASRDDSAGSLRAIVNDVTNVDLSITRNTQDTTGMDKSAAERLLLLGDYSSAWTMVYNDAAGASSYQVHKTVSTSNVVRSEDLRVSGQILLNEVVLTDMVMSRAADGSLIITAPAVLQSGTDPTWTT